MNSRTLSVALVLSVIVTGGTVATPAAAAVDPPEPDPVPAAAAADAYVAGDHPDLRKSPDDMLVRVGTQQGTHGLRYVAYERTHRGLPVIGGDLVVAVDAAGNLVRTAVAQRTVLAVDPTPRVGPDTAVAAAGAEVASVRTAGAPRLAVLARGTPRLVWEVAVTGLDAGGAPTAPIVYVDAGTGQVADSIDLVRNGAGNGFYNGQVSIDTSASGGSFAMQDPTRPGIRCGGQNGATFTGPDDNWGNGSGTSLETACVDVLYGAQRQWDMLAAWLGRDGLNGNGGGFPARVGWNVVNASWNGRFANFGHSQDNQRQVTAMDVVAHEYGHAIFQTTPGGVGFGRENGGLNEGTGDIFGALTEAFAGNPNDPPDFLVGEEINFVGNGEIRNMFDPAARGHPGCWSTDIPDTEVHAAAGPLNHWFYLVSEGSDPAGGPNSPICAGGPPSVTGVGVVTAGQIYYNALLMKTSTWRYVDVRSASVAATVAMFGADSPECATVRAAWDAVSVPARPGELSCGEPPPGGEEVFLDDFEVSRGWTRDPSGTDTATTGVWERTDPQPTSFNGVALQLGTTVSGTSDLVTGAAAGAGAGAADIDGGVTSAQSPAIVLPAGSLQLTFHWYLAHLTNATDDDFLRVSVVAPAGTVPVFTQAGSPVNRPGAWQREVVDLSPFSGQTVRLLVEAADAAGGSLVEAAVDDVRITSG